MTEPLDPATRALIEQTAAARAAAVDRTRPHPATVLSYDPVTRIATMDLDVPGDAPAVLDAVSLETIDLVPEDRYYVRFQEPHGVTVHGQIAAAPVVDTSYVALGYEARSSAFSIPNATLTTPNLTEVYDPNGIGSGGIVTVPTGGGGLWAGFLSGYTASVTAPRFFVGFTLDFTGRGVQRILRDSGPGVEQVSTCAFGPVGLNVGDTINPETFQNSGAAANASMIFTAHRLHASDTAYS